MMTDVFYPQLVNGLGCTTTGAAHHVRTGDGLGLIFALRKRHAIQPDDRCVESLEKLRRICAHENGIMDANGLLQLRILSIYFSRRIVSLIFDHRWSNGIMATESE